MAGNPNERSEREFMADVNQAVADTEDEIFADALGDDPLDNDADTSLEEMGDGLEGEDLDDETDADEEEGDESEDDDSDETDEDDEDELEAEADDEPDRREVRQEPPREERQDRRHVPLRQERDRRRAAETEAAELRRQLAEMNGRVTELSARVNAPPPKPAPKQESRQKPDMFADPEGYEKWVVEEAERRAEAKMDQRLNGFRQEQQQEREGFLNENLNATANGPRGIEFQAAYRALTSLERNRENGALVTRLTRAPDPGQAIIDWFQDNGADEFRENIARQLGLVNPSREVRERRNGGDDRGQRHDTRQRTPQQPRYEVRLPPSLNNARGGGRQQVTDPDMLDDSDSSVFSFATRQG